MHFLITAAIALLLFTGCGEKEPVPADTAEEHSALQTEAVANKDRTIPVADLEHFPQHTRPYIDNLRPRDTLLAVQKSYELHYFTPWRYTKPPQTLNEILWPFESYRADRSYGHNLKPVDPAWIAHMKEQGNFEAYGTANRYGVTTRYTDLRNFPTSKPLFKDPATAGEGYPFDYLQNSSIHANEPIYISHYSKEGGWAYVFTSYATGWIDVRNIAYIDKTKRTTWMKAKQIYITVDDYPITNSRGEFLMYSKVGMLLPAIDLSSDAYEAMVVTASINGKPHYHTVELPRHSARETVSAFTKENVLPLIDEILQTTYGWGGIDKERDCSSTLRDLFAPMGIWLPRNSYQQAQVGKKIDLSRMSDQEKVERITQEAIPFETLLYKKGHILLYLGSYEGNIAVFHNVWGIKTLRNGVEGRKVIGKSVITSLQPGKEQPDYDESEDILKNLMSMNVITAAQAE